MTFFRPLPFTILIIKQFSLKLPSDNGLGQVNYRCLGAALFAVLSSVTINFVALRLGRAIRPKHQHTKILLKRVQMIFSSLGKLADRAIYFACVNFLIFLFFFLI